MANNNQYRLLWSGISRSKKIKQIQGDRWLRLGCHLVYTWLQPWADDDGRLIGDPLWVLANVVPYEGLNQKEIKQILIELHRVNLIYWYEVENEYFIQINKFKEHQRIRQDRYKSSSYPSCQPTVNQVSGSCQPSVDLSLSLSPSPSPSLLSERKFNEKEFEVFYLAYPNHKGKKDALERWKKLAKNNELPELPILLAAIKKQVSWRNHANGEFRPEWKHPATWLNKGCWEDDTEQNKGGQHGFQSNTGKTSARSGSDGEKPNKYSGLGRTMFTE